MMDSYVHEILPFRSKKEKLGKYLTSKETVRFGRILEDIDALAGMISITHAFTPSIKDKLQVVTASVDRIDLLKELSAQNDLKLSGFVSYVGNSSMEVSISIEGIPENLSGNQDIQAPNAKGLDLIAKAKFVMVALNRETMKPIPVPKLSLDTKKETDIYQEGALHKARKQVQQDVSLLKKPPNVDEMKAIHRIYLESKKEKNYIGMKNTEQSTLILTHPQDRNFYNKIFGGYLMRVSYELAFATALLTTKCTSPNLVAVDDITFRKPVSVGSILSFHSRVDYCPGTHNTFQVSVIANVVDPTSGLVETTNDFHFTFVADEKVTLPRVLPESYEESLAYVEGMRRNSKLGHN